MTRERIHIPDHCVVAVYDTMLKAEQALRTLEAAGYGPEHVSLVMRHVPADHATYEALSLGDDSLRDAAIGGALGGLTGLVGATTMLTVGGVGLVLMTGPFAAVTGAIVGAFLGAMKGWGIHDKQIRIYEDLVTSGHVLVVVTGEPPRVEAAKELLKKTPAVRVDLHAKQGDDSKEIDDRSVKPATVQR